MPIMRIVTYRIGRTGCLRVVVCNDESEKWAIFRALRNNPEVRDLTFDVILQVPDDIL